ncbi:MAG: hypothetical protein SVY53_11700 [Chloroflexota bacterium]|nr:hypothetical protein [Chloroflexota bacterium]
MSLFRRNKNTTAQDEAEERELEQFKSMINARLGYVDTDKQSEVLYNAHLLMAAAQLADICHTTGASPKEVLATYTELAEGLRDWFNLVPLRKKLEAMLDEKVHSKWAVKEQPVMPTYTPILKRRQVGGNGKGSSGF